MRPTNFVVKMKISIGSCSPNLTEEESELLWKYVHKKFRKEKETRFVVGEVRTRELSAGSRKRPQCVLAEDEDSVWKKSKTAVMSPSESHSRELAPESLFNCLYAASNLVDMDCVLDHLRGKFEDNWSMINFGEDVISEYIQFCAHKRQFQPAFWHVVNLNLRYEAMANLIPSQFHHVRKRCINFLTSLEIFDTLTTNTMFHLFKENIYRASMLAYILIGNLPSAEEEIRFILGSQDLGKEDCTGLS